MSNDFMKAFNPSLDEAEKVMGESWCYAGATYTAIEIEDVSTQMQNMPGGRYKNISAVLHVRLAVFTDSAVTDGKVIEVRGEKMRVSRIEKDGDDARALFCTSAQIRVPDL